MRYEEALELAGSSGRYQWFILFLSWLYATMMALNNGSIAFLGAKPDHWCYVPEVADFNLSIQQIKELTIPQKEVDGEIQYSKCEVYACSNWTDILHHQVSSPAISRSKFRIQHLRQDMFWECQRKANTQSFSWSAEVFCPVMDFASVYESQ